MRISQLPDLPSSAPSVEVPCTYNGADYKAEITVNADALPIYGSGDSISGYLYGFGHITSSSKDAAIVCPMPKMFQSGAAVTVSSLLVSMRVHNGGYLGASGGIDMTSLITSATCQGTALIINLRSSTAFTYGTDGSSAGTVTNNTPMCGYVSIAATVN